MSSSCEFKSGVFLILITLWGVHKTSSITIEEEEVKCKGKFNGEEKLVQIANNCLSKVGLEISEFPNTLDEMKKFDDKCYSKCIGLELGWFDEAKSKLQWKGIELDIDNYIIPSKVSKVDATKAAKKCFDEYETERKALTNSGKTIKDAEECQLVMHFSICYSEGIMKIC